MEKGGKWKEAVKLGESLQYIKAKKVFLEKKQRCKIFNSYFSLSLFNKYLSSIYSLTGTVLGSGSRTDQVPAFLKLPF